MANPVTIIRIAGNRGNSPIELRADGDMFDLVQDGEIVEFSPEQFDHFIGSANALIRSGALKLEYQAKASR